MRTAPHRINVLLPVWGKAYVEKFLSLCLPSLLAPGNIPALSQMAPCIFTLLAPSRDVQAIARHPLWPRLNAVCAVEVVEIDDLISQSNSTVLTLAYALAIRAAGPGMLDTCFMPLVSDYVLANGALRSVARAIFGGASGVLAGNYQVVSETMVPWLEARKSVDGLLDVEPRELVALSLRSLHIATLGSMIGTARNSPDQINRLFWRVDETCIVGRFYLMHMIGIRPETEDFVIAAASDYSLIPELCPSGNVVRIGDSDDYFVLECQPRRVGAQRSQRERFDARTVASGLANWATVEHRANAQYPVVYHSGELPLGLDGAVRTSATFIEAVRLADTAPPQPSRHHPVWIRAIEHHVATSSLESDPQRIAEITGDESIVRHVMHADGGVRSRLLGRAPDLRPWHPRWRDVRAVRASLSAAAAGASVALVSDAPERVRSWLRQVVLSAGASDVQQLPTSVDRRGSPDLSTDGSFDVVFLLLARASAPEIVSAAMAAAPLMKRDGTLILAIGHIFSDATGAFPVFEPDALVAGAAELDLLGINPVGANRWRIFGQTAMMHLAREAMRSDGLRRALLLAGAGGLAVFSAMCNAIPTRRPEPGEAIRASSVMITYRRVLPKTSPVDQRRRSG